MNLIYISMDGDDTNDGRSRKTAVRSWRRASSLANPDSEFCVIGMSTVVKVTEELENNKRREIYSKSDWG